MPDAEGVESEDELKLVFFVVADEADEGVLRLVDQVLVFQHLVLNFLTQLFALFFDVCDLRDD